MSNENIRGRHRAPGRHNPLNELKLLARESAQPAMKGAAVVAATGGLVASFAGSASAETVSGSSPAAANVANIGTGPQAATEASPAVVGPATTAAPAAASALATIGFSAQPQAAIAARKGPSKPVVIEDIQVKTERAAAKAAAARKAAAAKASRDLTRRSLTSSTSATKSTTNTSTPSASSGTRASRNWATAGQCTWGALAKWYQSEGYYPGGWTGNAMVWDTGAAAAGYTVSGTPRTRSILVMEPGVHGSSSVGHVAWVTRVSGNQVTIIEMNALAGPYNYNTRTLTDGPGMKYIYAP
ncbi:CHAP domain-containing protein [Humibacillus xanthopallidus]|uniref:Surface antigen n=1 Tax=Humibacillus xanthopallidus TaxID=412689 RepID=A0A543H8A4_9MICO|nr:CHAP domain-containing protein [Humibacillus xanthopallidus]TQM54568.1 surface antigen [Humibacillus xanthopallidus]